VSLTTFVCWKWNQPGCRSTYNATHVNIWASMVRRNFAGDARIICITDDKRGITECETFPLWKDHAHIPNPNGAHLPHGKQLPSCYRRLKIFSEPQTRAMGIERHSKVVSIDLDIVIVRDITPLFAYETNEFIGWKRIGPGHPNGYNGSIYMFRTGTMDRIWDEFDPRISPMKARRAKHYGSDQGWMGYVLRGEMPGWGKVDGIYSFSSDICAKPFPHNARLISFNGKAKPWSPIVQRHHPWIAKFWRRGEALPCFDYASTAPPRVERGDLLQFVREKRR